MSLTIKNTSNMRTKTVITKTEMKAIFKQYGLKLSFPNFARKGNEVTDWSYWYNKDYTNSDLKKFVDIIRTDFSDKYEISNIGLSGGAIVSLKK